MEHADVFRAIADPTRRAILDQLAMEERTAGDLAKPFQMSQPAVSRHLRVLLEAGLVAERRDGRHRHYRLTPEPMMEVAAWMEHYQHFWKHRLEALRLFLDKEEP